MVFWREVLGFCFDWEEYDRSSLPIYLDTLIVLSFSCVEVRYNQAWRLVDLDVWYGSDEAWNDGIYWRLVECWTVHYDTGIGE